MHDFNKDTDEMEALRSIVSMQGIMETMDGVGSPEPALKGSESNKPQLHKNFDLRYDEMNNPIISVYLTDINPYDNVARELLMMLFTASANTKFIIKASVIYGAPDMLMSMINAMAASIAHVTVDIRMTNVVGLLLAANANKIVINDTSCVTIRQLRVHGSGSSAKAKQSIELGTDLNNSFYNMLLSKELLTMEEYEILVNDHEATIWLFGDTLKDRVMNIKSF